MAPHACDSRCYDCVRFYDRLMPEFGLETVHREDDFVNERPRRGTGAGSFC